MLCYIKDIKTFQTISKFDSTDYSLAEGESGQVTIYQKNAVELTTKYVGMWLIINKELFYISGATPNDDSIGLEIQSPIYAFTRQVEYNGALTYGELIKSILDNDFGINCSDSEYALTYMRVTNTDATDCTIETDDYGYIIPSDIFDDALYSGVAIDFTFTNDNLLVNVYTANYETGVVIFNDGSTTLESESYDENYIAKVTVIHDLPDPEPEPSLESGSEIDSDDPLVEEAEDEDLFEVIDFYLSSDNHISTTPPLNRAKGKWKYYTASQDESPLSVAIGAFSHNNDNHKIEFRSSSRFALYQPIKMRLRGEVFNTIVTARILSSEDNRYYYKCGNLATTLTEKIDENTDENSEEIKQIKKKVAGINETYEELSNTFEEFDETCVKLSDYEVESNYCKMPDGTLIQWGINTYTSGSTSTYQSIHIITKSIPFPVEFYDTNYTLFGSGKFGTGAALAFADEGGTTTSGSARAWDVTSRTLSSSMQLKLRWMAIGRWK